MLRCHFQGYHGQCPPKPTPLSFKRIRYPCISPAAPTGKNASTTLKFSAEVMRRNFGARVYAPKLFYQAMLHAPKIFKAY